MIEVKTLTLKFSESDLERIRADKKRGETWEQFIFRKTVKEID